jgi:hypothetical protein
MNQKGNCVTGNQSIVSGGVTEGTIECVIEDLHVHNAEIIKGGPHRSAGGGSAADDVMIDGRIITAENFG